MAGLDPAIHLLDMTMFTWLNKQGVRSDKGFEFQFTGRFTAEYRENNCITKMHVEGGVGGIITIYEGTLESLLSGILEPSEKRKERDRLVMNLRDALAFQGLNLDLAPGWPG
jgi:hypothetical protein